MKTLFNKRRTSVSFFRVGGALATAILALTLTTSTAYAQDGEVGVVGDLERTASTTPEEKMDYASAANTEVDEVVKSITKLVEAARRDSDVEQLQCLNNKLTAVRALRGVSESAEDAMQKRLEAGDLERADHEFRKIAVALAKARQLMAEAERCTDSGALRDGSTTLVVEGGEVGSDEDTKSPEFPVEYDVSFDPPDASPFF